MLCVRWYLSFKLSHRDLVALDTLLKRPKMISTNSVLLLFEDSRF